MVRNNISILAKLGRGSKNTAISGKLRITLIILSCLMLACTMTGHISPALAYLTGIFFGIVPLSRITKNQFQLLNELKESESRYRLLADNSTDIIMNTDVVGKILFISPSIEHIGNYKPADLLGKSAMDIIHPEYRMRVKAAQMQAISRSGQTVQVEFLGLPNNGHPVWFESNLRAVCNDKGKITSVVSIIRDISARKALENALAEVALTDQLTGLPNRRQFDLHLEGLINSQTLDQKSNCLAIIDLDHFKQVNDHYGHSGGDEVLRNFAHIAKRVLRMDDILARVGGEEFALLLPNCTIEMAQIICNKMSRLLAENVTKINKLPVKVTVSIGLATITGTTQATLHTADQALYRAKTNGRDQLAIAA